MPMVPCPECKVPQFYRNKPKAGSKRRKCAGCRAKHLQRAQLREEDRAERKAQRSVTCDVCNCDMQLPSTRSASASFHTCERCGDYSRCAHCGMVDPVLHLRRVGRGAAYGSRHCAECKFKLGLPCRETLYECPQCEESCNLPVQAHLKMYAKCAQCKHEESADVVGGDLVALARSTPFKIPCNARLAAHGQIWRAADQLTEAESRKLVALAEGMIQRHMHVTDAEKVQLADRYDRAMRYPGHCCAVCGARDPGVRYDRVYFDPTDPSLKDKRYSVPGPTRELAEVEALSAFALFVRERRSAVEEAQPSAGEDRWDQPLEEQWCALTPAAAEVFRQQAAANALRFEREGSVPCVVPVHALPPWLSVKSDVIKRWKSLKCGVYIEHDDDEGEYERVVVTALDLRHVMRVGGHYFSLVAEAVATVSTGGARATDLATMFVCGHCMVGAPGSRKLRATAPELSLANRDRGRRYLPLRTVERVFDSLTGAHRTLDKLRWRLPVASVLERTMLATVYLHVMALKVADEGRAAGGRSSGDGGRSHARLSKHTMYFPISLVDAHDSARGCVPCVTTEDAVAALRIAVERVQLVFVGPDSKFDRLKRAALSMQQMRVCTEVVYTLIMLGHMRRTEKWVKELRIVSARLDKPGADLVDLRSRAVSHGVDDAALERELRARSPGDSYADVLQRAVTVRVEALPGELRCTDASLVEVLDEALQCGSDGVSQTVAGFIGRAAPNVSCRAVGGDAAREASDCEVSDVAQVRGRGRAPRGTGDDEEEPVAGCRDASNMAGDVIFGVARLLRRGTEALDDYRSQSTCLYGAYHDLFPTGEGLVEGKPLTREMYRHLMVFYDGRFAQDLPLVFNMADTITRHAVNRAVFVRARKSPGSLRKIEALMADPRTHERLLAACQEPRGAAAVQLLHDVMPFVNLSAQATPYTDASRTAFKGTLFGYNRWLGPACRASPHRCLRVACGADGPVRADFLSAAPDDLRDLSTARDSLPFRKMFRWPHVALERGPGLNVDALQQRAALIRSGEGEYSERARWLSVVRNPVAATLHFDRRVTLANRELLGLDATPCGSASFERSPKGLLGRFRGCVVSRLPCRCFDADDTRAWGRFGMVKECNGRGSQHVHMMTYGSAMPMFVSYVASIEGLRGQLLAALETQVGGGARRCARLPLLLLMRGMMVVHPSAPPVHLHFRCGSPRLCL
jgi:hypothetical protein